MSIPNEGDGQLLEAEGFFANFQLLWNLSYLGSPADRLLFLPRAHTGLVQQAEVFRKSLRTPWKSQVALVLLEDLIERLVLQPHGGMRLLGPMAKNSGVNCSPLEMFTGTSR